jgi:hypothetical protein
MRIVERMILQCFVNAMWIINDLYLSIILSSSIHITLCGFKTLENLARIWGGFVYSSPKRGSRDSEKLRE